MYDYKSSGTDAAPWGRDIRAVVLNPGVGIIFTPATLVQAYVMMDYASSMYLTQMKAFNFKLGFNMLIGSNRSSRIL